MAANKSKRPRRGGEQSAASMAMSFGFAIAIPLVLCILGGVALDNWLHTTPWFILAGVVLGLVISGYQLWNLAQVGESEYGDNTPNKPQK